VIEEKEERTRHSRLRGRVAKGSGVAVVSALCVILSSTPASAYTTTGAKWPATDIQINYSYVNGDYRSGFTSAVGNYRLATDVNLTGTLDSGPTFTARNTNYGATGWEGQADWTAPFGVTTSAQIRLNDYYLQGAPVDRLKVVWLHEIGHGLGLGHVDTVARVMYTSASAAYNAGVRELTSDEISGINDLY